MGLLPYVASQYDSQSQQKQIHNLLTVDAFYSEEYNQTIIKPDSMDYNSYKLKALDKDVFLCALEATEEIMSIFPTLQSKRYY